MTGIEYIVRDSSGNEYRGSTLLRAIMKMPETERNKIEGWNFLETPETMEDIWDGTSSQPEPNAGRVYRA